MKLEIALQRAVNAVIGPATEKILLHRPYLPSKAWEYVKDSMDTGWVSSAGGYVSKFEEELARFTGCRRAVATVTGTAALEVCFHLAGVCAGDEVICPALTFVATPNAISRVGAIPHFVDVSLDRLSLSPGALEDRLDQIVVPSAQGPTNRETGRRIAAVCLMHCLGHPGDICAIAAICERFDLPLIEDAAESLGSTYQGKHTGRFGLLAAMSFNGNKILSTGGGGAILTDNEELGSLAKHLTTTAKTPHAWDFHHDAVGWNYRMPSINAALGLAQLEILPMLVAAKRQLADSYRQAFCGVDGIQFIEEPADSRSNYWLNGFLLDASRESLRDVILKTLNDAGYQCRPLWKAMHKLPMYQSCPSGPLPCTESACRRTINIPSSADLADSMAGTGADQIALGLPKVEL